MKKNVRKTLGTPQNHFVSFYYHFISKVFCFKFFNLHNKELNVTPVKRKQNTSHLTEES